jgi:tetratricopeptide (TPR) repeat protein
LSPLSQPIIATPIFLGIIAFLFLLRLYYEANGSLRYKQIAVQHNERGVAHFNAGNYQLAIEEFDASLANDPTLVVARQNRVAAIGRLPAIPKPPDPAVVAVRRQEAQCRYEAQQANRRAAQALMREQAVAWDREQLIREENQKRQAEGNTRELS